MSAISSLLFYWRILPWIVRGFALALQRTLSIGGAVGVRVAANIFIGMVEAPLLIKPYMANVSRSELFTIMTCGMATIAGTVIVLYASILAPVERSCITPSYASWKWQSRMTAPSAERPLTCVRSNGASFGGSLRFLATLFGFSAVAASGWVGAAGAAFFWWHGWHVILRPGGPSRVNLHARRVGRRYECRAALPAARYGFPNRAKHPVEQCVWLRARLLRQRAAGDDGLLRAAVDASELC